MWISWGDSRIARTWGDVDLFGQSMDVAYVRGSVRASPIFYAEGGAKELAHYGRSLLGGMDTAFVNAGAEHALRYERQRNQEMREFFARRSGTCTAQEIHALCKADLPLTPSQCLEYGFVDEVITTIPQVSARPDYAIHS